MIDELIRKHENCKLFAYKCPAGIYTIGWGNTFYPNGQKVKEGDEVTQDKADAMLVWYIKENIEPVFEKIPYKLTEGQKGAIASLCYNIGVPSFLKSKLYKAICEKDIEVIFKNWDWIKSNGKVLKGLAKRRAEELSCFLADM